MAPLLSRLLRRISVPLGALLLAAHLLVSAFASGGHVSPDVDPWRRTAHGWQRMDRWIQQPPTRHPAVHPLTIALFEGLLAAGLLVAFSPDRRV